MKVVAIVQARMGSSRLPGKSLLSLGGQPMLRHVLDRVRQTAGVHDFVLATSTAVADNALQQLARDAGWHNCYRGSERDVLGRVQSAAAWLDADVVLRVTADCPFWDPAVGSAVVEAFRHGGHDYVSNDTLCSGYPDGLDAEVFSRAALETSAVQASAPDEREHVTRWMRRNLRTHVVACALGDFSGMKLSVDRVQDYAYARRVWRALPAGETGLLATLAACAVVDAEDGL